MSLNKVMLIGNVGQEPSVRYLDTGICVASVRLATTERGYTMRDGTQVPERVEWHSVIFWEKLAEVVEKYVHKGDKLYVEGKIQTRTFVDRQGLNRTVMEVMATNMEMLTAKSAPTTSSQPQNTVPAEPTPVTPSRPAETNNDDKAPF